MLSVAKIDDNFCCFLGHFRCAKLYDQRRRLTSPAQAYAGTKPAVAQMSPSPNGTLSQHSLVAPAVKTNQAPQVKVAIVSENIHVRFDMATLKVEATNTPLDLRASLISRLGTAYTV